MIVTSKISGEKYQWVKIPRTATVSYRSLFFPDTDNRIVLHTHTKYNEHETCDNCANEAHKNYPAFVLIRNPISRFISSLRFISSRFENLEIDIENTKQDVFKRCDVCGEEKRILQHRNERFNRDTLNVFKFWEDENIFYDFMYDNFQKNCNLKPGMSYEDIFTTPDSTFIRSFFKTQLSACYHPAVKIFKYENIDEYNYWIEKELGYDVSKLKKINASRVLTDKKEVLDYTSKKFTDLVKHLFYDDFKYFGY